MADTDSFFLTHSSLFHLNTVQGIYISKKNMSFGFNIIHTNLITLNFLAVNDDR